MCKPRSIHQRQEDTNACLGPKQVSSLDYWGIQHLTFASSPIGETPPPPPRACFGRDKLIEKIINLSESLTPIALIGAGGIGKTSIALTVLHHDLIKGRFGDNRRFIRCDQFPASVTHFLSRLSKVIGAGVENPEDLAPLRPFLSSRTMILFLDNAESILDPRGTNAREIYAVVEELSRCSNICLCITSRISTIPPDCKCLDIPTLSMVAAHDTFYRIYDSDQPSGVVDSILGQLDFHPLSITLLATVAHHNKWNTDRLSKEWDRRRTDVLHTRHDASLATTIELSLASPMFQGLDPNARELLGVVAFFPQGIDEKNLEWLFPAIPDRTEVFDGFCVLSLTYKSNGFFVMLAPLREYLYPKDPGSSPLLHATKDHYFTRLSVYVDPAEPGFEEAGWITSEDVNVEHLLDVFTSVDANSADVWDTCASFMRHLNWHKPRLVTLEPRARALPDDHPSKPDCLFQLSQLFTLVGNNGESKQLLTHTLKLRREREDDFQVAEMLRFLSSTNKVLCLYEEGIEQAKEALEIYRRHNRIREQGYSLFELAWSLHGDNQIDAAEEATSQAIDLLADDEDAKFTVCGCYRLLGKISYSKGEVEKATKHFETALGIASSSNWHSQLFWGNYNLAELFFDENRSADAHVHIERAKSHAINDPYNLGRAMKLQARIWYRDHRFEEGKSEAMRAADVYEGIGATKDVEDCRAILRDIEEATNEPAVSHESDPNGEPLEAVRY